ncbi:MAG TPA: carbon-nitrogen hydrolase family protein [Pyrinomonadaceae bacterium]|nr:carbon-nitrogen hydrolase family protein [Pyrinomonadaceae bacterium]
MTRARSIAVAQTVPVPGDVDANVAEHLRLARAACEEGAQVLVFPEMSLTGYELELACALAFTRDDARLAPLVEAAEDCSLTLVVGAPVGIESRLHIGAFILSPGGAVSLYTKQRMGAFSEAASCDGVVPPPEANFFQPGELNPLVRFGGNTAAVAVCADTGRPSHAEAARARGAEIYLASMFVIPSEFERETANLREYAARHSMVVAFANYGGPSGGLASAGRSAVWSERGELLVQLPRAGAGVAVASECESGWRGKTVMLGE